MGGRAPGAPPPRSANDNRCVDSHTIEIERGSVRELTRTETTRVICNPTGFSIWQLIPNVTHKHEIDTDVVVAKAWRFPSWSFEEKTFVKQSMISEWEKCAEKVRFAVIVLRFLGLEG